MGEAAVGEAEGNWMSRTGCPVEVAVRWSRERRRSLGPKLVTVRGRGWSAGAGGRVGADVEAAEANTLSLTTSINLKAPGRLVMLL